MVNLPPDSRRYLAMHRRRVCRPFHLRWLLPLTLRDNVKAWTIVTRLSIISVAGMTAWYAGSWWMAAVAFLPAMTWNWHNPVMVDAYGMAMALGAAVFALQDAWVLAILFALLAGVTRETAPIWAAVYAWHPILLVGLIPVAVRWLQKPGPDTWKDHNAFYVAHPIKAGQDFHRGRWRDPQLMLWPWAGMLAGVTLLAGGVSNDAGGGSVLGWGGAVQLAVALALGYSQLLVATDSVRLYQWAAPVLALACVTVLPAWALPLVAASIVFNPWRGTGA